MALFAYVHYYLPPEDQYIGVVLDMLTKLRVATIMAQVMKNLTLINCSHAYLTLLLLKAV